MPTATFPGVYKNLEKISDFVVDAAQKAGLDDIAVYAVQLAVDEACTNIIEHAYGGEEIGDIQISTQIMEDKLTITLRDWGRPFKPENVPDPNLKAPIQEIEPRGLGLFLIRKMMDEIQFEFSQDSGNVLTMTKYKSNA